MKIQTVAIIKRYVLSLTFDDGTSGQVDLAELAGRGVFKGWEETGAFEQVAIGSGGELEWACGVDLCADALYLRMTSKSPEALYPNLLNRDRCA